MCRQYVIVERGEHVTRKGRFPFTHFFKEPGAFYNVFVSSADSAAKYATKASATKTIKSRGLTRCVVEKAPCPA